MSFHRRDADAGEYSRNSAVSSPSTSSRERRNSEDKNRPPFSPTREENKQQIIYSFTTARDDNNSNRDGKASRQRTLPQTSAKGTDESRRVFPFVSTPSGNLKIIPNQVVFESKKVSVLVADPKRTKVNVKSEPEKPHAGNSDAFRRSQNAITRPTEEDIKDILHSRDSEYVPNERYQSHVDYEIEAEKDVYLEALGFNACGSINWNVVNLPGKSNIVDLLMQRIINYVHPDCFVQIDHDVFNCHLLVLQCYSPYFNNLREAKRVELPESNVTPAAFTIVYDWMIYSGTDSYKILNRENILEVLMAAQYLEIKELEDQCRGFINSTEMFTEDTAYYLFRKALKMNNQEIADSMLPRIQRFFLTLVSSKDFLDLPIEELCPLLRSDHIAVHCEIEVFMSAVRWLMHDFMRRKTHLVSVMQCIRFGLIAPWQLVDIRRNPENPEILEVTSYSDVQRFIEDGLAYVIIKYWYGNKTQKYYHWIDLLALNEPTPRQWLGQGKKYVTYREFLQDLPNYRHPESLTHEPIRSQTSISPEINGLSGSGSQDIPPPFTMAELLNRRKMLSQDEFVKNQ